MGEFEAKRAGWRSWQILIPVSAEFMMQRWIRIAKTVVYEVLVGEARRATGAREFGETLYYFRMAKKVRVHVSRGYPDV